MSRPEMLIGVDLGGTNIRAAVITPHGEILARNHLPTPTLADGHIGLPADLAAGIVACVRPLLTDDYRILGVGIGAGGQYNPRSGTLLGINTGHPAFVDYPLGTEISAALGLPVRIDNDVKAAAYAEWKIGAGRGCQHMICVAVGTGIGGALVIDGKLLDGRSGLAGHIGQIPDALHGMLIENLAGGVPLGKRAIREAILADGETTADLFLWARAGEHAAVELIDRAGQELGRVLAGLAHTLDPERIVMAGSVGLQPEFLAAVNRGMLAALMARWQDLRVIPAQSGTDAGQIGAALSIYDHLQRGT